MKKIEKELKRKQKEEKFKLKENEGITLIALVITIIVLLILAGISIAMLTGENGILTQANNAKVEQSHGAVREGIALAYNEYQIEINTASNTKLATTETVQIQGKEEKALASYSSFLDFLSKKGYADSSTGKINVEALTGSKQALGNGTDTDVYKIEEENGNYVVNYYNEANQKEQIWSIANNETSTDNVEISITKTNIPNNQNVGAVLLTVDKVIKNGTEFSEIMQLTEEEYRNMLLEKLETMEDEQKENIFVEIYNNLLGMNFSNIDGFIEYAYNQRMIPENSKDAFYEKIGGKENFDYVLAEEIYKNDYNLIGKYDKETEELQGYVVKNPDGEKSNTYLATQNGDYTFIVEIDGKEYTETVNVNNIATNQESNKYNVEKIEEWYLGLKNIENDSFTTFSNAYIICNGQIVDVTGAITNGNNMSIMNLGDAAYITIETISENIYGKMNDILIVKNGQYYYGRIGIPKGE